MGSPVLDYMRLERMLPQQLAMEISAILVLLKFKASLFVLAGGLILAFHFNVSAVCTRVLMWPMFAISLFLMVVFILGLNGIPRHHDCLKTLYLLGHFLVIPALAIFVILGFVAVGGVDFGGVKVREYNLTDYSGWLRGRVAHAQYWAMVSACIRDRDACNAMKNLVQDPDTGMFVPESSWAKNHKLGDGPMPIESGCCKPPSSCPFTYVNGTWTPTPGASTAETNVDCSRWSNDQQTLCFQCDSCKAGLLDEMKKGWSMAAVFVIVPLIVLIGTSRRQVEAMDID